MKEKNHIQKDMEFHEAIAKCSGNRVVEVLIPVFYSHYHVCKSDKQEIAEGDDRNAQGDYRCDAPRRQYGGKMCDDYAPYL